MDNVNHPKHYNAHKSGVECIDVAECLNFNLGNAFKYVFRAGNKNDAIEDLEKAKWYLKREKDRNLTRMERMQSSEETNLDNITKIIVCEPDKNKSLVLLSIWNAYHNGSGDYFKDAISGIDTLIKRIKKSDGINKICQGRPVDPDLE